MSTEGKVITVLRLFKRRIVPGHSLVQAATCLCRTALLITHSLSKPASATKGTSRATHYSLLITHSLSQPASATNESSRATHYSLLITHSPAQPASVINQRAVAFQQQPFKKFKARSIHLYLFIMLIEKLILGKMIVAVLFESCFLTKLPFPFGHLGIPWPALGKIGV